MASNADGVRKTTVLLASRQEIVRRGLGSVLRQICPVRLMVEAGTIEEIRDPAHRTVPFDLVSVDLDLVGVDIDGVLSWLHETYPAAKIVITCEHSLRATVAAAILAGVHGIIPKSASLDVIGGAYRQVLDGHVFVPADIEDGQPSSHRRMRACPSVSYADLSARQRDVLDLLIDGLSNKQVARALSLSEGTVKNHVSALMRKLGISSRAGAVAVGLRLRGGEGDDRAASVRPCA